MSEALSQDPELSTGYSGLGSSYPPTPATPSSTVQDGPAGANLPPFSTFSADVDNSGTVAFGGGSDRLFGDTRLLDISNWDYYTEARLLDRSENGLSIIAAQPQYRPWESKSVEAVSSGAFTATTQVNTLVDSFGPPNGISKLPSFQSQFQTFNEPNTISTPEPTLTTLTPVSPGSASPTLTTLNSNFHTLSAVNPRNYPLVPAPIQAREIPSIQQQFLDERHIQLYAHSNTIHPAGIFPTQNGTIIQNISPTVVTVLKPEPELKIATIHHHHHHQLQDGQTIKVQNIGLHPAQFQNPMATVAGDIYNGTILDKKLNNGLGPSRNDFRKKERRKVRASSLESSTESDGASNSENSGQVAAVSSTAGYKTHHIVGGGGGGGGNTGLDMDDISGGGNDKQVKKKRKRCGECIGCQRKDNCGDCAPCRNDKSHQICKQRRCEKLTEKKNLYGDASFLRGESRRGRGKGRAAGSYRGRKPAGSISNSGSSGGGGNVISQDGSSTVTVISNQSATRPSPQSNLLKTDPQTLSIQQQTTMAPMSFYADPNRFTTPVWQSDPTQGWPQGQFIQQITTAPQPVIETYQQYPNGIYQATYQQSGFETNTFYTGAVQVLTRPPSVPNSQGQLTPRPNSASGPASTPNRQTYSEFQQTYASTASTPTMDSANAVSRPSSVNSSGSVGQTFSQQQQQGFTPPSVSSSSFSPGTTTQQNVFSNNNSSTSNSGNAQPGYPPVSSSPQLASHSSSGYPGEGSFSGPSQGETLWQATGQVLSWDRQPLDDSQTFELDRRVSLNNRLKTMILNKQQQQQQQQPQQEQSEKHQSNETNSHTDHFLWCSHHHQHPIYNNDDDDDGGSPNHMFFSSNPVPKITDTTHELDENNNTFVGVIGKCPLIEDALKMDTTVYGQERVLICI